jgi:predicted RNase H-like nuclease (RuvC/YqgF family)
MNSIKDIVFGILILMVVVLGYQYWAVWKDALEKADAAEVQQKQMEKENVELQNTVAELTVQQSQLSSEVEEKEQKIKDYEEQIAKIQEELIVTKKQTIVETDEQIIANDFKKAFNLEKISTIRVINAPPPGEGWRITSLVMPIEYAKLATNAKSSLVACQAQTELKDQISSLNTVIKDLKDQTLVLEEQKSRAYAEGYEKAFALYKEVNEQYINLLRTPPKADLSINWLGILGGIATGGLLCVI